MHHVTNNEMRFCQTTYSQYYNTNPNIGDMEMILGSSLVIQQSQRQLSIVMAKI